MLNKLCVGRKLPLLAMSLVKRSKSRRLEKELNRKEKALAEIAALLVLKKKAQAVWGEEEDA